MSTAPAVSVVIPCHNAAPWLPGTLAAILRQSFRDLEVVVVDDGSTDHPENVVAAMADPRIRLYSQGASGTPSRPRNVGIRNSHGGLVFFCDADDVMAPDKIHRQVALFEQLPAVGLVFTNFQVIGADDEVLEPSFLAGYDTLWRLLGEQPSAGGGLNRERMVSGLLRANFIGTSSVAVRRSVLDDVGGFDEGLASSEDYDLWLRIARRHDCAYLDMIGHGYRRHPASLMQSSSTRHPLARIEVLRRQLAVTRGAADRRAVLRRLAANHGSVGYGLERDGDSAAARREYVASLRCRPNGPAAWGLLKVSTIGRFRRRFPVTGS
jgi:glycosyltransferase involved in cell wall biosynthesis